MASNYIGQTVKSVQVSGKLNSYKTSIYPFTYLLGSKCDPRFKSVFKLDQDDDYEGGFEVKICSREIDKENVLSMFYI